MRLPVDSVNLWIGVEEQQAAEEFFQNAGPLYHIVLDCSTGFILKRRTVDAMIDKFVPVDGGNFYLDVQTHLTREQLERLVLKCELSDKKVKIEMWPEGYTNYSKATDFFDFGKYYSTTKHEGRKLTARREGAKLELCVECWLEGPIKWEWN
uniref:Methyltransf_21 domain-containing protein n=1 Tax=Steinernema glaseri TaxID=37863 RepID=A0A1I7ZJU8_9BILA